MIFLLLFQVVNASPLIPPIPPPDPHEMRILLESARGEVFTPASLHCGRTSGGLNALFNPFGEHIKYSADGLPMLAHESGPRLKYSFQRFTEVERRRALRSTIIGEQRFRYFLWNAGFRDGPHFGDHPYADTNIAAMAAAISESSPLSQEAVATFVNAIHFVDDPADDHFAEAIADRIDVQPTVSFTEILELMDGEKVAEGEPSYLELWKVMNERFAESRVTLGRAGFEWLRSAMTMTVKWGPVMFSDKITPARRFKFQRMFKDELKSLFPEHSAEAELLDSLDAQYVAYLIKVTPEAIFAFSTDKPERGTILRLGLALAAGLAEINADDEVASGQMAARDRLDNEQLSSRVTAALQYLEHLDHNELRKVFPVVAAFMDAFNPVLWKTGTIQNYIKFYVRHEHLMDDAPFRSGQPQNRSSQGALSYPPPSDDQQ